MNTWGQLVPLYESTKTLCENLGVLTLLIKIQKQSVGMITVI